MLFINLDSFGASCLVLEISAVEHIIGDLNVVLTAPQYLFPEIMTPLPKIIHRPCCEMFHVVRKVVPVNKKIVPT